MLVYNQHGHSVRYIGMFRGESMYERPTGIAIDRKAGRLYLADTPRNLVFILDLQGNILKRLGKDKNGNGSGRIRISDPDRGQRSRNRGSGYAGLSRIQILDFDGNRTASYRVASGADGNNGLAVDKEGNIYISYVASSVISMYKPDGMPIGTFGQSGSRIGEFRDPRGMWVVEASRIYVAERGTRGCKSSKSAPGRLRGNFPTLAREMRGHPASLLESADLYVWHGAPSLVSAEVGSA